MPDSVYLSLAIYADHRGGHFADFELWEKTVVSWFLPAPGDRVALWALPEDAEGELWPVAKRYWRPQGTFQIVPVLVLTAMWVDPPENDRTPERYRALGRSPWWTRSAGDPQEQLLQHRWNCV